jgi:hypothetical protein
LAFYSFSNGVLGGRQELQTNTADWQTPNIQILVEDAQPGVYIVEMSPLTTYDLDMDGNYTILPYNYTIVSQASGGGATITVFAYYR